MRSTPSIGTCRASRSTANPHQPAFPIITFGPHPEERQDEDCPPQAGISLRFLKLPRNSSSSPCVSIHTFVYLLGADDQHPNPFRTNAIANAAPPPDRRAVAHAFHPADLRVLRFSRQPAIQRSRPGIRAAQRRARRCSAEIFSPDPLRVRHGLLGVGRSPLEGGHPA